MPQRSLISINGDVQPQETAKISVMDRGFLFGDNVFETLVAFGPPGESVVLDTQRHLERLRSSAEGLLMDIPWSNEELAFELKSVADQVAAEKVMLRLVITRGEGLGLKIGTGLKPNKVVYAMPAKIEDAALYREGLSLKRMVSPTAEKGPTAKTGNYLRSIVALLKAERAGMQDILWTNANGEITEASTANIFFIGRHGDAVEIATPAPLSGLLLGITRETMINLLNNAKIPVTEQIIYPDELARFDEAFVCSTVRGLVPVNRIDRHRLHTTRRNGVFQHLERLFLTWVQTEVGYRVDWNTGAKVEG